MGLVYLVVWLEILGTFAIFFSLVLFLFDCFSKIYEISKIRVAKYCIFLILLSSFKFSGT